eukprot:TRINITY_DN1302_c1_g1_i1.p1 TRINITY_DN1302_c1_g1~~TRINITY_DN1302_c1_g1_i1.p1  ORF type:complete len:916 (+),score=293.71 TRINITY_DN1302_c1_g1_i1:139-2886(+)
MVHSSASGPLGRSVTPPVDPQGAVRMSYENCLPVHAEPRAIAAAAIENPANQEVLMYVYNALASLGFDGTLRRFEAELDDARRERDRIVAAARLAAAAEATPAAVEAAATVPSCAAAVEATPAAPAGDAGAAPAVAAVSDAERAVVHATAPIEEVLTAATDVADAALAATAGRILSHPFEAPHGGPAIVGGGACEAPASSVPGAPQRPPAGSPQQEAARAVEEDPWGGSEPMSEQMRQLREEFAEEIRMHQGRRSAEAGADADAWFGEDDPGFHRVPLPHPELELWGTEARDPALAHPDTLPSFGWGAGLSHSQHAAIRRVAVQLAAGEQVSAATECYVRPRSGYLSPHRGASVVHTACSAASLSEAGERSVSPRTAHGSDGEPTPPRRPAERDAAPAEGDATPTQGLGRAASPPEEAAATPPQHAAPDPEAGPEGGPEAREGGAAAAPPADGAEAPGEAAGAPDSEATAPETTAPEPEGRTSPAHAEEQEQQPQQEQAAAEQAQVPKDEPAAQTPKGPEGGPAEHADPAASGEVDANPADGLLQIDVDADAAEEEAAQVRRPHVLRPGTLEQFHLQVVYEAGRTGFEEHKDYPIRVGDVIAGRYQVLEYLGSAAFSRAVQCLDLRSQGLVCVKIIKNNKDFFDQSLDEIKLLQYINASGCADENSVLQLYDYFYYKEHLFLVAELLRDNLYEFSKYNRESGDELYFTIPRLQRITKQCLTALSFVHGLGLMHCDLKPENILIKSFSRCEVKVIDFGSSCFTTDHLSSYVQSRCYRAPEVILGCKYGQKIDIWSLGAIIPELYTGHVLFQNDSVPSMLARITSIMGPLPGHVLAGARHAAKHLTRYGVWYERTDTGAYELLYAKPCSLRERLGNCDDELFVDFVSRLLDVDPERRPTAAEALQHPWLKKEYSATE